MNNKVDISFNDSSTSSIQCTIIFIEDKWRIVDSDGVNKSLNGTWFLINNKIKLENESIIKVGSTCIKVELSDYK